MVATGESGEEVCRELPSVGLGRVMEPAGIGRDLVESVEEMMMRRGCSELLV